MKKRLVTVIAAALALLTLTAASNAAAPTVSDGVLVRTDDGYRIPGTLRDADGQVVGTLHGTLIETTTGFNTCPVVVIVINCGFPEDPLRGTCNLLGGEIRFNFSGKTFDSVVQVDASFRIYSALCRNDPNDPTTYQPVVYAWSQTHTIPGEFPDIFTVAGTVQQITPTLFKWAGGWGCSCFSGSPTG